MTQGNEVLLEINNLTVHHGQLCAVDDVSLQVNRGEVFAMIGANGAGKSTLLRSIAGLDAATSGSIKFQGQEISKMSPHRRVGLGVSLVPEGRRLFASLTLEENLQVGAHKSKGGPFNIKSIYELFDWMHDRRRQRAWQFSGGEQQAIAIARALVANPQILLLDELSLGLAPIVIERIYAFLPEVVSQGVSVLLVEQDVSQGVRVANRVHCLLEGRTSLEGTPSDLSAEEIERAYFGADLSEASSMNHGEE